MTTTFVKVRRNKTDKNPVAVTYDFGDNVNEAVSKFDGPSTLDHVVFGLFQIAAKQQLQDYVRSLLVTRTPKAKGKAGKKGTQLPTVAANPPTAEEIQALVDQWKPSVERASKRTVEKARKVVDSLSPEERKALLERLQNDGPSASTPDVARSGPIRMGATEDDSKAA